MTPPTCFVSYSWDNDVHKDWVRSLAENLQKNGVIVSLDQWDIYAGADLTQYMETSVRNSEYVLLICTPTFASKANLGKGGVGYEKMIVTGEIFQGVSSPKKFVPILKEGTVQDALPSYLNSKSFIDFRDSNYFDAKLEELLRHLHSSPKHIRPALGTIPPLNPVRTPQTSPSSGTMSRRDFLGLPVFIVAAVVSCEIVKILQSLPEPTLPPNEAMRARLVDLLGFSSDDQVALMPNWQNVAVNTKESAPTPSWVTAQAVSEVTSILREQHVPMSEIVAPWNYQPSIEHLVAFGFETSQPLYRRVAGWKEFDKTRKNSEFQGYDRHNQTGPFDLPWKSNLGTEADENDPKESYYTLIGANKKKTKRRVWALQRGGTILRPEFDDNNVCLTDFISIVHIPNYLNSSKYTMTLAGGIQAAGTKAIGCLLADKTVMETILNKAPMLSPWQAIIRVSFTGPKLQPTFLVQDVAPIGINEDILADWRRVPPTF